MTTVYVPLRDRVVVCTADGSDPAEWTTTSRLEGSQPECVAASAAVPNRVFVGTFENGLRRVRSGARSFERLETPFDSDAVMSLAISPHDPDVIFAGTEPSRVYRSDDGGDTWTHLSGLTDVPSADEWSFPPRPDTHHVRCLAVDPFDPDRLYAGIEAGAFVLSRDGGETWQDRPPGSRRDNHTLATHPDREGRVYAAAGDGYAESNDAGDSWHHPTDGLDHTYCWGLAVDPGDPDAVMLSSASSASRAHRADRAESYVYRRTGGGSWMRLDGRGLPTGEGVVRTVFGTTGADGAVYAANNRGLFVTADFGDRWERVDVDWGRDLETETPRGLVAVET